MQYLIRLAAAALVALSLSGYTVITVAGAAVGVAATAGGLAVDAAVGTVKLTGDTGYLFFFSPSNVEAVIKVLNACSVNNRYWVFAGGLTDVRTIVTVTDTQRNAVRTYINPQGTAYAPIQDTSAFATCP